MTSKYFYITTPIYYVNDVPHIGHAYTTFAADTLARFKKLQGYQVKLLTGTDEHGQKVEKSAAIANKNPQEFVDDVSQIFQDLANKMGILDHDFMRTTQPRHIKAVQHLWQKLVDAGQIYLGSYDGWYAVRDEAFYDESELVNGKAPTGADVEWVSEPSYFFKLSAWQEPLLKYFRENPNCIAPDSRRNEVIRFIEGGLNDLSISRTTFSWGIPVPGDEKHVMYVWMDALTNYITSLGYPKETSEELKDFWPESHHIVGKDILRFHCVYWPAFLMAAGMTPPKQVFAHGWWTNEGQKISKSLGNTIDPFELIDSFGCDAVRYFLLREVSFGQDGDFSRSALICRVNSDLANSWGNLAQRVLSFINKQCDSKVPQPGVFIEEDKKLLETIAQKLPEIEVHGNKFAINRYSESVWQLIFLANQYVDAQKPWSLKNSDVPRMETILYILAEAIRQIAILTLPLLPIGSAKILEQLGINAETLTFSDLKNTLKPGVTLPEPQGVFPRI
jgi:methionyl-tRNA synthetase